MEMTSYDGVLSNIMLPGKDGFAVLGSQADGNDTPILLLTARDGIEDRVKGSDLGADDYLIKPFAFEKRVTRKNPRDDAEKTPICNESVKDCRSYFGPGYKEL